ncbi:DsbA family oxidoreductase [Pseudonocardia sp. KRD291]|uniref:DsbA family oxidoreductase n=1 Tax=Pseudonocardia sp. KRD291 TaxID=2792007 RepID=UPI001C4A4A18|nr:DsbA family oxidoreductase [Pseudonocardia sp. KRD291]MBW0104653.1 DsbA family oxidoreductase [Pseudonocardia sp. KRD291]
MKVEIWSDVVCPWCAIGRARFESALAGFAHRDEVDVRWRSFQLDPTAPREREGDRAAHLAEKYGMSIEKARGMEATMTATAAEDGLEFHFDIARDGNTFDAHRLLHLARELGGAELQDAVKGRLFRAAFTDGEPIGDPETLVRLVAEAGLDAGKARAALEDGRHADDVAEDLAQARRYGITGVPFFVIDERYGVSGAQPADALREVLDTAWAESHPLTVLTPTGRAGGDACADGSCQV